MIEASSRDTFGNLVVGVIAGGFSAAIGAAIGLFILVSVMQLFFAPGEIWNDPTGSIYFSVVICAFGGIFAGVTGVLMGLLVALVDSMIHGRLHSPDFPNRLWLLMGSVLGAAGSVLLSLSIFGSELISYAVIGGFCGLIAGPIFGWLYRERTRPNHLMAQGESTRE